MTAPVAPAVDTSAPVAAGAPPWGLLSVLWVSQNLGIGFLTVGLVAILRSDGASLEELSLVSLLGLAWPLKLLWAPLLDRYGSRRLGHHRSWLLVLQPAMVVALLALLPFGDPAAALGPLVAVCALYVLLSATQDVATDALGVRLLRPQDRGLGNGVQVGASYVGTVLGGGLCVLVYDRAGWAAAVLLLAALTLIALAVVLRFREPERDPRVPGSAAWGALIGVFRRPGVPRWALGVVPLVYGGAAGVYALPSAALVDAGWSLTRIGVVTGVVVSVPAALAGPLAGWLVRRWGRAVVLAAGGVGLAAATAGLVPLLRGAVPLAGTVAALGGFLVAYTALNVVVYTVSMDLCRPATAGTDFTTLTTVPLIAAFLTASAALATAALVGYVASAALWCVVALAGVVLGVGWLRAAPLR
ncbi:MFS transporter [Modestobacter roseus]|uniref:Putative MFS family arabinose efflux permease n=1 Tax=Modestobacter roseus TaxID=1181884 RepID=A0A562IX18_9ACTN|nr:MFS transporter [Modestobacter roseus]TWH75559.1 putative MFS family arabinose efflux permease [Modestobacter roseus]